MFSKNTNVSSTQKPKAAATPLLTQDHTRIQYGTAPQTIAPSTSTPSSKLELTLLIRHSTTPWKAKFALNVPDEEKYYIFEIKDSHVHQIKKDVYPLSGFTPIIVGCFENTKPAAVEDYFKKQFINPALNPGMREYDWVKKVEVRLGQDHRFTFKHDAKTLIKSYKPDE